MQNNNKSGGGENARRGFKEKGYYIVLFLCVLAVGISGYIFISTAIRGAKPADESLSVPLTAQDGETKKPSGKTAETAAGTALESALTGDDAVRSVAAQKHVAPMQGETLQTFSATSLSYNETTQDWRLHSAVDIAGEGAKVVCCMAGTVTDVYDDEFLGTTVVVQHDGGYESRYSNLTAMPTVKKGDQVAAGAVLGAVGSTAILESAEAPHLHFAVYKDGAAVDPAEFLS